MVSTIAGAAQKVGASDSTIKRLLRNGLIEREADGSFNLRLVRRALEAQASLRGGRPLGGAGSSGGMSASYMAIKLQIIQEELELTRAKRMRAQQELAKGAGELILKGEALRAWAELMMNFRDSLLSVGDQIALRCDKKPAREIATIVREAHEEILRALAEGGARTNATLGTTKGTKR